MPLRLLPWSPDYGTSLQFDADDAAGAGGEATSVVDTAIEADTDWRAVRPSGEPPTAVQLVDGVRRVEANGLDEAADGGALFALFGSLAVGGVRLEAGRAWLLDDRVRIVRRYLQTGGAPETHEVSSAGVTLRFVAETPPKARSASDLVAALNRTMLEEEAKLAEELSADESALTLVDGPLRLRAPGQRVVGYIKRIHQWYIDAQHQLLLPRLGVGERTPLFRITEPGGANERISWFMRIADLSGQFHPLAGVLRLEVPGTLPVPNAVRAADQSALALPRLASSPVRDPRSPQNLTPVGALESALSHRLGDRRWIARLITAAVSREATA